MEVNGRPLKEVASRFKKLSTTVPQVLDEMDGWLKRSRKKGIVLLCVFTTG